MAVAEYQRRTLEQSILLKFPSCSPSTAATYSTRYCTPCPDLHTAVPTSRCPPENTQRATPSWGDIYLHSSNRGHHVLSRLQRSQCATRSGLTACLPTIGVQMPHIGRPGSIYHPRASIGLIPLRIVLAILRNGFSSFPSRGLVLVKKLPRMLVKWRHSRGLADHR